MKREDGLDVGRAVPGAVLPALALGTAVAALALLGAPAGWTAAAAVAVVAGAFAPTIGGAWIAAAIVIGMLLAAEPHPGRTAVAVAAVHLLHVVGSLSLVVPLRARIALTALRPTARRFVIVQIVSQAAGLAATLLPRGEQLPAAVLAGGFAVLAFTALAVRMLRHHRHQAFPGPRPSPGVGGPS